jgi:hypothetical protein
MGEKSGSTCARGKEECGQASRWSHMGRVPSIRGGGEMNSSVAWGIQSRYRFPKYAARCFKFWTNNFPHPAVTLGVHQGQELECEFCLWTFQPQVTEDLPHSNSGNFPGSLPLMPPFMLRVLRIMLITTSAKGFMEEVRDHWVRAREPHGDRIISWGMSILTPHPPSFSGYRDEAIRVNRPSKIGVNRSCHSPIISRVGMLAAVKTAGRLLDGVEWNGIPRLTYGPQLPEVQV